MNAITQYSRYPKYIFAVWVFRPTLPLNPVPSLYIKYLLSVWVGALCTHGRLSCMEKYSQGVSNCHPPSPPFLPFPLFRMCFNITGAIFYVLVCFHRLLPLLSHRAKVKLIFVLSILVAVSLFESLSTTIWFKTSTSESETSLRMPECPITSSFTVFCAPHRGGEQNNLVKMVTGVLRCGVVACAWLLFRCGA